MSREVCADPDRQVIFFFWETSETKCSPDSVCRCGFCLPPARLKHRIFLFSRPFGKKTAVLGDKVEKISEREDEYLYSFGDDPQSEHPRPRYKEKGDETAAK